MSDIKHESREWLKNPSNWPNWPLQTVKHNAERDDRGLPRVGLVVDFGGVEGEPDLRNLRFVEANLFTFTQEDMARAKASEPLDLEKFLADGWVVD